MAIPTLYSLFFLSSERKKERLITLSEDRLPRWRYKAQMLHSLSSKGTAAIELHQRSEKKVLAPSVVKGKAERNESECRHGARKKPEASRRCHHLCTDSSRAASPNSPATPRFLLLRPTQTIYSLVSGSPVSPSPATPIYTRRDRARSYPAVERKSLLVVARECEVGTGLAKQSAGEFGRLQ
jgi:hypothetical protein